MFNTSITQTLTEKQRFIALRAFLLKVTGGSEVRQTQQNRVAMPTGSFITMTPLDIGVLSTNNYTYSNQNSTPGKEIMSHTSQWRVQLDCYGEGAGDMANIISTVFRSEWACEAFGVTGYMVRPVYSTDPRQTYYIDGESQYGERWTIDVTMLFEDGVGVDMYFFDSATITPTIANTIK